MNAALALPPPLVELDVACLISAPYDPYPAPPVTSDAATTIQGRQRRWRVLPALPAPDLGAPPLTARLLHARGIADRSEAAEFLDCAESLYQPPSVLSGVDAAVARLRAARERGERAAVYGDFDADGVTGTALMARALGRFGLRASAYIPHRVAEGHGLNTGAVDALAAQGARVIVTVDCGVTDVEAVAHAKALGVDVIVTDHHLPGETAPEAAAIVNPKLDGRGGASDQLTGVGMALKVAQALLEPEAGGDWADGLLELAAIGAITDLAPLQGENRYVVHRGLRQLRRTRNAGLLALMLSAGVEAPHASAQDIGYRIGPRLNAAGRLGHADSAYELLMTEDAGRADALAAELEAQNRRRQQLTEQTLEAALAQIEGAGGSGALAVAGGAEFNPGVVGLVAGKLAERYGVPALVYAQDGGVARASCRTAAGFHWRDALASIAPLLDRFGGHEQAAGFTCAAERLPEALGRLRTVAEERLDGRRGPADGVIDAEASPAEVMRGGEFEAMQRMAPFGVGNPAPLFLARDAEALRVNTMGAGGRHLRLSVRHGGAVWDAVAFRQSWADGARRAHLVYRLEVDRYRGAERLRLNVEDYAPAG